MCDIRKAVDRCVIIVEAGLSPGRAANAVGVIALTIGQRHPELVGAPLVDGSGNVHPGLIPIGITVLAAPSAVMPQLLYKGLEVGCDVIDFPAPGQQTTNYRAFMEEVAQTAHDRLQYAGIALVGERKTITKIVANLPLLK